MKLLTKNIHQFPIVKMPDVLTFLKNSVEKFPPHYK